MKKIFLIPNHRSINLLLAKKFLTKIRTANAGCIGIYSQISRVIYVEILQLKVIRRFMVWYILIFLSANAFAEGKEFLTREFLIQIKDHKFQPLEVKVPAGQKFKLVIENLDKTLEEFESVDLKKEKIVGGGKRITLVINSLEPGEYKFFGDFHQKTAQGKIIAQ